MQDEAEERDVQNMVTNGGLDAPYQAVFGDVSKIIDTARESAVRSVNAAMTAAYWLVGRRIVEFRAIGRRTGRVWSGPDCAASDAASPSRTSTTCACSTSHISLTGLSRHRLEIRLEPPNGRSSRRRLENSTPPPPRWASTTFAQPFRSLVGLREAAVGEERERPSIL